MKYLLSIFAFFITLFSFSINNTFSYSNVIFNDSNYSFPYCNHPWECWLKEWVDAVKDVNALENKRTASQYAQDVVKYLLSFVALVWTFIIIYAWFNLFTSIWDEEKAKKSKQIIIYTLLWIILMYLAGPIIEFVIWIFL